MYSWRVGNTVPTENEYEFEYEVMIMNMDCIHEYINLISTDKY